MDNYVQISGKRQFKYIKENEYTQRALAAMRAIKKKYREFWRELAIETRCF